MLHTVVLRLSRFMRRLGALVPDADVGTARGADGDGAAAFVG